MQTFCRRLLRRSPLQVGGGLVALAPRAFERLVSELQIEIPRVRCAANWKSPRPQAGGVNEAGKVCQLQAMSPCALNPGYATLPGGRVKQGWQPGGFPQGLNGRLM